MSGGIGDLDRPELHALVAVEGVQQGRRGQPAAAGNRQRSGAESLRVLVDETLRKRDLGRGQLQRLKLVGPGRGAARGRRAELVGIRHLDLVVLEGRRLSQRLQGRGQRRQVRGERLVVALLRRLRLDIVLQVGNLLLLAGDEIRDQSLVVDPADRPDRGLDRSDGPRCARRIARRRIGRRGNRRRELLWIADIHAFQENGCRRGALPPRPRRSLFDCYRPVSRACLNS